MKGYVGITIGPIFDTILMAHSPAAMWYASSMFSALTEKICENVTALTPEWKILSPCYNKDVTYNDGIGRYHDRIIIENADTDKLDMIINNSITAIGEMVCEDLNTPKDKEKLAFLKNYFQVRYVCLPEIAEGESIVLKMGELLDAMEQMISPNAENTANPFVDLFKGENFRNQYVAKRVKEIKNSQLKSGGHMKSIPEITGSWKNSGLKRDNYFAVVEADGDNMGKFLKTLPNSKLQEFSEVCFEYAAEAAEAIGRYGGMTIYAGGDDLMFLAPVCTDKGNVFELCNEISGMLKAKLAEKFSKEVDAMVDDAPAVSFGIAIRREKFPLYEAWQSSVDALYMAKSEKVGKKCMFIDMQKGSGQAVKLAVPFDRYELFNAVFDTYKAADDEMFKSLIYTLNLREKMLEAAIDDKVMFENVMANTFDNAEQKKLEGKIKEITGKMYDLISKNKAVRIITYGKEKDNKMAELGNIKVIEAILRLSKFMVEKGGERSEQVSGKA